MSGPAQDLDRVHEVAGFAAALEAASDCISDVAVQTLTGEAECAVTFSFTAWRRFRSFMVAESPFHGLRVGAADGEWRRLPVGFDCEVRVAGFAANRIEFEGRASIPCGVAIPDARAVADALAGLRAANVQAAKFRKAANCGKAVGRDLARAVPEEVMEAVAEAGRFPDSARAALAAEVRRWGLWSFYGAQVGREFGFRLFADGDESVEAAALRGAAESAVADVFRRELRRRDRERAAGVRAAKAKTGARAARRAATESATREAANRDRSNGRGAGLIPFIALAGLGALMLA